jgi:hypothetical protein
MLPSLSSSSIARASLKHSDIETMFALFRENYDGATPEIFERDLANKNWVILLHDARKGELQGFSTLALYETTFQERPISVVYSGDTIIRREYWGTPELPSSWIKTVLEKSAGMPQPLYWLLISSGYKTYRFLTVFYREFFPRYDKPTPPDTQALMDTLATRRFGPDYVCEAGVVRFRDGATPLRGGVAEVTDERLHDPHIAFYTARNPGHANGDELVCITQIHRDNFTPAGKRMAR